VPNTGTGVLRKAQELNKWMWVTYDRGFDNDSPENPPTKSWKTAWNQVKAVDEAHVFIYSECPKTAEAFRDCETWLHLILGNDPEETLADWLTGERATWVDEYFEAAMEETE
jgi:hypothetical protein